MSQTHLENIADNLWALTDIARAIHCGGSGSGVENDHGQVITSVTEGLMVLSHSLYGIELQLERIANILESKK